MAIDRIRVLRTPASVDGRFRRRLRRHDARLVGKQQPVARGIDRDRAAMLQLTEEDLIGQHVADFLLDDARERARPEDAVVSRLDQPGTGRRSERLECKSLNMIQMNQKVRRKMNRIKISRKPMTLLQMEHKAHRRNGTEHTVRNEAGCGIKS